MYQNGAAPQEAATLGVDRINRHAPAGWEMLLLRLRHVTRGVAAGHIGAKVLPSAARCCGSHRRQHLSNVAAVLESRAVIEIRYGTMMHVAVSCACLHHSLRNGDPRVPKVMLFPREIKNVALLCVMFM